MHPAIEVRSLSVLRGHRQVLRDVSFEVAVGEVYALLGGNGAGKSSCLLSLLGFLPPASGSLWVEGRNIAEDLSAARGRMAYLPESASLYGHLSARENLRYFLALAGLRPDAGAIEVALDKVALQSDARGARMERYSKGMRQKVAIALSLLRNTPILLLDEPTSGLDPVAIDEFNRLVRELSGAGRTVLMVTHDVYGACQVADRIGLLREGELVGNFVAEDSQRIDTEAVHAAFVARQAA